MQILTYRLSDIKKHPKENSRIGGRWRIKLEVWD